MQQHRLVDQQFGQVAQAYLASAVHAQAPTWMRWPRWPAPRRMRTCSTSAAAAGM